jgi:hypothetical protein
MPTQVIAPGFQFGHAAIDRASGHPGRRRHGRHTAVAQRKSLARHKQPAPAFVQERYHPRVAGTKTFNIDHRKSIQLSLEMARHVQILSWRCSPHSDSFISRQILSRSCRSETSYHRGSPRLTSTNMA